MSDFELKDLPQATLYAVARNDSAEPRYRKAAVRLMLERGYQQVNHADLSAILADVKADMGAEAEVSDIVEQAIESPLPEVYSTQPTATDYVAAFQGKTTKEFTKEVNEAVKRADEGPFRASFTTKNF